jgi:hypothetical protein
VDADVGARIEDALAFVCPAHAQTLVPRLAADLEELSEAAGIADVAAVDDDHVTGPGSVGASAVVHVMLLSTKPSERARLR